MKKILSISLLLTTLAGCAQTANQIAGTPPRPRISQQYQDKLMQADKFVPGIAREAIKHEWEWNGALDKAENRAGY